MSTKRAISLDNFLKKKFVTMDFSGEWFEHVGIPQSSGIWFIWGASFNGKTGYCLQLAKYLTKFSTVIYDSLEEGARLTMQKAMIRTGMKEVSRKFILLDKEPIEDLKARMRKPKSPQVIIIDSFQLIGMSKKEYLDFKEEFSHKTIIFISHSEGKEPAGKVAKFVRYDADIKIRIEGYKAMAASRYGGGATYTINKERAEAYHGKDNNTKNNTP